MPDAHELGRGHAQRVGGCQRRAVQPAAAVEPQLLAFDHRRHHGFAGPVPAGGEERDLRQGIRASGAAEAGPGPAVTTEAVEEHEYAEESSGDGGEECHGASPGALCFVHARDDVVVA
ncbi:hypothetical protein AB0F91_11115 [Amycolatopsis sp. NPDC023774]|uniref:hypothetical protein n=1 Tax=Amycolatopsis sp. NPDC023774 TaxID=3155015 RepID=UPI0033F20DEC